MYRSVDTVRPMQGALRFDRKLNAWILAYIDNERKQHVLSWSVDVYGEIESEKLARDYLSSLRAK